MKTLTVIESTHDSEKTSKPGKVEKKGGKRIGFNYIILKSLKKSQKNDVIKCIYIKSLVNFGICVIKEGTYGDSKDKDGRDIRDRLIWQKQLHELLQNKVMLPRLLGCFEENDNYYLVIERIKGQSLGSFCKKHSKKLRAELLSGGKLGIQILGYALQIIELLDSLHQQNIVHRDVTAANFMITPRGKVVVIDMELSYSLELKSPAPPFQLGTYGYMSPQQEATKTPTIQDDIFSIGAILLLVWTSISPSKLTNTLDNELTEKIQFFIPDPKIADIVAQCLQSEPNKRPQLAAVRQIISEYRSDLKRQKKRNECRSQAPDKEKMLATIQSAVHTLATPLLSDSERGWFSENRKLPSIDKNKINKAWYASYNLGVSGVIYLLSRMHQAGFDVTASSQSIQKGLNLIEKKYIQNDIGASPSLHYGSSGVAASLTTAIESGLIKQDPKYTHWIQNLLNKENDALGIMNGLAGQGIANLICRSYIDHQLINDRLSHYANFLLNRQTADGSWTRFSKDGKNKVNKGFANGVSGIIYFLLEYGQRYSDEEALSGADKGLQWLVKKGIYQEDMIQWRSSKGKDLSPWWCEGTAGITLTFLKAYASFGDPRYKKYAMDTLNKTTEKILDNNLSQCHGLSGIGEIYLEAYQILQDEKWLDRANWVANVIYYLKKQHPVHGIYWLVEHERQPTASFMTGNSGILHFLLRQSFPNKFGFPLLSDI